MRKFFSLGLREDGKIFIPTNPEVCIGVGDPEPFQILAKSIQNMI